MVGEKVGVRDKGRGDTEAIANKSVSYWILINVLFKISNFVIIKLWHS